MKNLVLKISYACVFIAISLNSTIATAQSETSDKKSNTHFIAYAGATFNYLDTETEDATDMGVGYLLGLKYQRGRFFYWEVGAQYNKSTFALVSGANQTVTNNFGLSSIQVPLNVGVNLLSATDRILGLRVFVGALPSFTLGVNNNDANIVKDDLNSFIMSGQAGVGLDIAFFTFETGYTYGFSDLYSDNDKSTPSLIFVQLGFRF
jgi:hypothetical protein